MMMAKDNDDRLEELEPPLQGRVRVGYKAPSFSGTAAVDGTFGDICLDDYIRKGQWLCVLFIPAAFSFVCPTEVLAFDNCIEEFTDRNCAMVFVSTDSVHSLWQWRALPRKLGGLGPVRVPLLSDQSHNMSRDYGVLVEKSGMDLRGTFIIDPDGIVQHITINNLSVGRSVLEALRLVEAFQAARENGALCPVNWKGGDTIMEETYGSRDKLIAASFADHLQVKNLDDNSVSSFNLVMPAAGHKRQTSAPHAGAHLLMSKQVNAGSGTSSKRTSLQPRSSPGVVTLDFADPLSAAIGARGTTPGSPHEYVGFDMDMLQGREGSAVPSKSASAASVSSLKKTVDALKRVSGSWTTPLSSPRVEAGGKNGYFD